MSNLISEVEVTLTLSSLSQRIWDVLVIGAGVAGSSAAFLLAKTGLRTLLVESRAFPREKVCGGCLNRRAQQSLARMGLLDELIECQPVSLSHLHLRLRNTQVTWPMPRMLSLRRSALDSFLVRKASEAGAKFVSEVTGRLVPAEANCDIDTRSVQLSNRTETVLAQTRCVIVADGLTRSSLHRYEGWESTIHPRSRIGVQTIVPRAYLPGWDDTRLWMVVGKHGYVGLSAVDERQIDIAAAIDPKTLNQAVRPVDAVTRILVESGMDPVPFAADSAWLATPALTRYSRHVAGRRVFLLGDAIGYVEPFTGEGMSWALASAEAVVPFAVSTQETWSELEALRWTHWVRRQSSERQFTCRILSRCLRHPRLAAWIVTCCHRLPKLRHELMRRTCQ